MYLESDFDKWWKFSLEMKDYVRFSALSCVLMSIRNLRVMTTKFPAFGVLFDTIRKAK